MVGVINPPSSGQTIDQFRSAAAGVSKTVVPSGPATDGSSGTGTGSGGTGGGNATVSAGSTPTSGTSGGGSGGYGSGAVMVSAKGWAVALVGLLAAGALVM